MRKPISAVLFFTIIFTTLYFFTACEDNNNSVQKIEYTTEAVNKAILEATKNQVPSDLQIGQFVKYEDSFQIELTDPRISAITKTEILDLNEDDTKYSVTLKESQTKFDENGNGTESISEQTVELAKSDVTLQNESLFNSTAIRGLITSQFSLNNDSELRFYNLSIEEIAVPHPNAIQEEMGCDINNPCNFIGTRIKFLVHEYVNKTDPVQFSVDRIYMNNGSFLNGTFSSCISRFFDTPERDYYIKQCSVLRDYN